MTHFKLTSSISGRGKVAFETAEATDDGLIDDIRAEQQESAIDLHDTPDGDYLAAFWDNAVEEASHDPDWTFADDEDQALF